MCEYMCGIKYIYILSHIFAFRISYNKFEIKVAMIFESKTGRFLYIYASNYAHIFLNIYFDASSETV